MYLFGFQSKGFVKIFSQLLVRPLRLLLQKRDPDQATKPEKWNQVTV